MFLTGIRAWICNNIHFSLFYVDIFVFHDRIYICSVRVGVDHMLLRVFLEMAHALLHESSLIDLIGVISFCNML